MVNTSANQLVIFGISNILSDLFECALALHLPVSKVIIHHSEKIGERDLPVATRLVAYGRHASPPILEDLEHFSPKEGELYLLGPTNPERRGLADQLQKQFGISFTTLIHPKSHVSPLATLGNGVFVGVNSVIGPGAQLEDHVFVNRGVTIGHDTRVGAYSRIQPGSNLGGLSRIGEGVTIGIGATLIERLEIGHRAVIGAGAVVINDVPADAFVVGVPAAAKNI